jgi:hypothetical protein
MTNNTNSNQYNYLLNDNLDNYLEINNTTYKQMDKFYNKNTDKKCEKITEDLIQKKIAGYDELDISHIPIVRDDSLKYSIYLETRQDSTFIYSMCFEELFFFDFDDKFFTVTENSSVFDKSKKIIEKLTKYYFDKLKIKLYWILYKTDNGVHAYCLSHKRNRRMEKQMDNLITETVKTCADADWIAFSKVRFGFCTRLSPKLRYKSKRLPKSSVQSGSLPSQQETSSTPPIPNRTRLIGPTRPASQALRDWQNRTMQGGSPYNNNDGYSYSKNNSKTYKYPVKTKNIDYTKILDKVIDLTDSYIIKSPDSKCLFDLVAQLYIKNNLVIKIRDGISVYSKSVGIPLGMFSIHDCKNKNNTDIEGKFCSEITTMTSCKISTKCKFVPLISNQKLINFVTAIKAHNDELRFKSIYNKNNLLTLFQKNIQEQPIIKNFNIKNYNKNNKNYYYINTTPPNNINNTFININSIKDLEYDSNNETILHTLLRNKNIKFNDKIRLINELLNKMSSDLDKKKLLNLPGGSPLYDNILDTNITCSYTPIMYLIKYGNNNYNDLSIFITKNIDYIDLCYEINNRYILTPLLLLIIEATENNSSSLMNSYYYPLLQYLLKNNKVQKWLNKKGHPNLIFMYIISRDYSKEQVLLRSFLQFYKIDQSINIVTNNLIKDILDIYENCFKYNNSNTYNVLKTLNFNDNDNLNTNILFIGIYYKRDFYAKKINNYLKNYGDDFIQNLLELKLINGMRFPIVLLNVLENYNNRVLNPDKYQKRMLQILAVITQTNTDIFYNNKDIIQRVDQFDNHSKLKFLQILAVSINFSAHINEDYFYSNINNIISAINLYKRYEPEFLNYDSDGNIIGFKKINNLNLNLYKIEGMNNNDIGLFDIIDKIIIKIFASMKIRIRKSLGFSFDIIKARGKIRNTDDSSILIYFETLNNPKPLLYNYNMSTGVEINAGGPSREFFTKLNQEISNKINKLDKLNSLGKELNTPNSSNTSNVTDKQHYCYKLGQSVARLIFIEVYQLDLKIPDYIFDMIIIYLNYYEIIKNSINNNQANISNINPSKLVSKNIINQILNYEDTYDDLKPYFEYSGNDNLEKFADSNTFKKYNFRELKNKLITFQKIEALKGETIGKFNSEYSLLDKFKNKNYQIFLNGFLDIYLKIITTEDNKGYKPFYIIKNMMNLINKKNLMSISQIDVIKIDDIINSLNIYTHTPSLNLSDNDIKQIKENFKNCWIKILNDYQDKNVQQSILKNLLFYWTGTPGIPKGADNNYIKIELVNNRRDNINKLKTFSKERIESIFNNTNNYTNNNSNNNNTKQKKKLIRDIRKELQPLIPPSHTCFNTIELQSIYGTNTMGTNGISDVDYMYYLFKYQIQEKLFSNAGFGFA